MRNTREDTGSGMTRWCVTETGHDICHGPFSPISLTRSQLTSLNNSFYGLTVTGSDYENRRSYHDGDGYNGDDHDDPTNQHPRCERAVDIRSRESQQCPGEELGAHSPPPSQRLTTRATTTRRLEHANPAQTKHHTTTGAQQRHCGPTMMMTSSPTTAS